MKKAVLFVLLPLIVLVSSQSVYAAPTSTPVPSPTPTTPAGTRYVTCDACGYCPAVVNGVTGSCQKDPAMPPPSNWKQCVKCLYPDIYPAASNPDPDECKTVLVDNNTNMPHPVAKGRQYTMLGCITSSATNGFEDTKGVGASSFVQALFDLLVFRIMGGLAFLYLIYGAFIILTSQADPERLNYGKRVVTGAVIGLIFTMGSVFIVNLIGSNILRIPGFGSAGATPTPTATP